jgi:integrase
MIVSEEAKRYYIINASKTRKRFALVCYYLKSRKEKVYIELDEQTKSDVASINEKFISKIITFAQARTLFDDLIQKKYAKNNLQAYVLKNAKLSEINAKVLKNYWQKVYSTRLNSDLDSAKYDLEKALLLIEPLAIQTAEQAELQDQLKKCSSLKVRIRATSRLNEILKWLERDFKLNKPSDSVTSIQYCTLPEFNKIVRHIENDDLKNFACTLFASGLRISEALALIDGDYINHKLNVVKQLVRDKKGNTEIKLPKRKKIGQVVVMQKFDKQIKAWIAVENKDQYRYSLYDALEIAARKALPDGPKRAWVGPHDLRHSHAVYLLANGASLTQVSLNLRSGINVVQKYYTGFAHTDESAELLKKMLK